MKLFAILSVYSIALGESFLLPPLCSRTPTSFPNQNTFELEMSSKASATEADVPVIINGQNIELTDALIEHVNKRIGGQLKKLASHGAIQDCSVILSVAKNPKVKERHLVEVVCSVKGMTFVCNNASPDMYASIDSASHALYRKLSKYKDNRIAGWHGGKDMGQDLLDAFEELQDVSEVEAQEEDDDFSDPGAIQVTNINSFDLENAMSVEEAVFALDYVDHDFFVFRNRETKQVSVVYKRNVGGVGLVEP